MRQIKKFRHAYGKRSNSTVHIFIYSQNTLQLDLGEGGDLLTAIFPFADKKIIQWFDRGRASFGRSIDSSASTAFLRENDG